MISPDAIVAVGVPAWFNEQAIWPISAAWQSQNGGEDAEHFQFVSRRDQDERP
jgi:hypothetical protein